HNNSSKEKAGSASRVPAVSSLTSLFSGYFCGGVVLDVPGVVVAPGVVVPLPGAGAVVEGLLLSTPVVLLVPVVGFALGLVVLVPAALGVPVVVPEPGVPAALLVPVVTPDPDVPAALVLGFIVSVELPVVFAVPGVLLVPAWPV